MRKWVALTATSLALAVFVGPAALAHHQQGDPTRIDNGQQQCTGTTAPTGVASVDANSGGANGGHVSVQSCDNVPPDGNVTVAGNPNRQCFYVVADGDPTNGGQADGFVGVSNRGGTPRVEGPADPEYNHGWCSHP